MSGEPSLHEFILHSQVLGLYRRVVRLTAKNKVGDNDTRKQVRDYAKYNIRAFRHITDLNHIRSLLRDGTRQAGTLESLVFMSTPATKPQNLRRKSF